MPHANLRIIPPYAQRKALSKNANLTNKDELLSIYQHMLRIEVASAKELEEWLLSLAEIDSAVSQAASILYIEMTCHTEDPEKVKAYQAFVENVEPVLKPLQDKINKKYFELSQKYPLDANRYQVFDRSVKVAIEMFKDENVPLQTEVALLSQEYQAICGAMDVEFDGKEYTMPEMGKFLEATDRDLRERAWRAMVGRRMQDKDKLEEIFDKMRGLRGKIASNAGFDNFRDYQFKAYMRFDYGPADCQAYHSSVQSLVVPLCREIGEHRRKQMGIEQLRPWDAAVDPLGREPLKPFEEVGTLVKGVEQVVRALDSQLTGFFVDMASRGLLDLESRKGKAPGGYQNTLDESRKPFIFMNAVGLDDDVKTLLHESGHAFHAYLSSHDPLDAYRHAPMEFCEVASMSMELMGIEHIGSFYGKENARRSVIDLFEGIVSTLAWVATIDSFQHWIYETPGHTAEDRTNVWLKLHEKFGSGEIDWSGLEMERSFLWHRQLHIFEVPFYYIEYGIAQLGALQIWRKYRNDPLRAIADYKRGLSLGGSRPLPELFKTAGIQFDFSKEMVGPLMDDVAKEWRRLVA